MTRRRVSDRALRFWKIKYDHGDLKKIAVAHGISRTTVSNAFKGSATEEVVGMISNYYKYEKF